MDYYYKYLKYKKKYLSLVQKGGNVSIIKYSDDNYIDTIFIDKIYQSEKYSYTPDYKINRDKDINTFTAREYTLNTEDIKILEEQILTTPEYDKEMPYTYQPEIIINENDKIPYFSIYSIGFRKYVFYKITEWFQTTVNKYYKKSDPNIFNVVNNGLANFQISFSNTFNYKKHDIEINKYINRHGFREKMGILNIINNNYMNGFRVKKGTKTIIIQKPNLTIDLYECEKVQYPWKNTTDFKYYIKHIDNNFAENIKNDKSLGIKVHLIVKFKYLFWMLEKIIINKNKFFVHNIPLFTYCKFPIHFSQSLLPKIFITEHQQEILHDANIVFYLYDTERTKTLIKILKDMFPDELNISSNNIPRFNIRINNTIYLGIGDGAEKENYIIKNEHNEKYDTFDEYKEILENCKLQETKVDCEKLNFLSSKISDHNLCMFKDSKCDINKLNSYNFLTNKQHKSLLKLMNELDVEMPTDVEMS